jgi:hypothetical protein
MPQLEGYTYFLQLIQFSIAYIIAVFATRFLVKSIMKELHANKAIVKGLKNVTRNNV